MLVVRDDDQHTPELDAAVDAEGVPEGYCSGEGEGTPELFRDASHPNVDDVRPLGGSLGGGLLRGSLFDDPSAARRRSSRAAAAALAGDGDASMVFDEEAFAEDQQARTRG